MEGARVARLACAGVLVLLAGCRAVAIPEPAAPALPFPPPVPLGLGADPPVPADNPLTREKVELGRRLFFDRILSRDRTVSCSSCHRPEFGFGDTVRVSPGISGRKGRRNAPTLVNRVYGFSFFWDGRAPTLEDAVMMPVQDTMEMGMPLDDLVQRVRRDAAYAALFKRAFPGAEVSRLTLARALASYVRTLRSGGSPYDHYQAGDTAALGERERRGVGIFFGRADCSRCHSGPNFTDERFHDTGVPTAEPGNFKTPTLRELTRTAPYMHDGSMATLEEVVEFYDRGSAGSGGGRFGGFGRGVRPLGLSAGEKADLVAFLESLTPAERP